MNVVFNELKLNFECMLQLSSFCADNITENSWGIKTTLTIYRGDDVDHTDGILQSIDVTIMGAEEFDLLEEYISGLYNLYSDQDLHPVLRIKVKGYSMERVVWKVTEENVRKEFNLAFCQLDPSRSAGSMYVGDNGTYILEFLDIEEEEKNMIIAWFLAGFKDISLSDQFINDTLMLHIC